MRISLRSAAEAIAGAASTNAEARMRERREKAWDDFSVMATSSLVAAAALSTRNTGRVMEADLAGPPSAQARGSTHRSLAAFFKRPQAALLKSALVLFYM